MRVTNGMMQNQLLNQLNKNMQRLSVLSMQQSSTKKIQKASDDPIIASRALKFRVLLAQNVQYTKTLSQAESWVTLTEGYMSGTIDEQLTSLKEMIGKATNESNTLSQRKAIVMEMSQIRELLASVLNSTHDTRYLFSGCRTDQEAIFSANQSGLDYRITENFTLNDIDFSHPYIIKEPEIANNGSGDVAIVKDCTRLKLGCYDIKDSVGNTPTITLNYANGSTATIPSAAIPSTVMDSTQYGAYNPPAGEVYILADTGEVIFGEGVLDSTSAGGKVTGIDVVYEKDTFKEGDKNPLVYFNCTDINTNISYSIDNQNIDYIVGLSDKVTVNQSARDVLTSSFLNDLDELIRSVNLMEEVTIEQMKLLYPDDGSYGTEEEYQEMIEGLVTETNNAVTEYCTRLFDSMLTKIEKHAEDLSIQVTIAGARMQKIEMLKDKLADENTNYEQLKSDNENANMAQVLIDMETMTTVYISSLQAAANILQMSLLNYL